MNIRTFAFLLLLPALPTTLLAQEKDAEPSRSIADSIQDLCSPNWPTVLQAREVLERQYEESIPALIELLDDPRVVPLENTLDLIYPGAKEFYGHGHLVPYALDVIMVRAAWVLEAIVFLDLGFQEPAFEESRFLGAALRNMRDVPMDRVVSPDQLLPADRRDGAIEDLLAWWRAQGGEFSRLEALLAALEDSSGARQVNALGWLRFGRSPCPGLDRESFQRRIRPLLEKILNRKDSPAVRQVDLLLADTAYEWLGLKE
jgi:hypothetical protein